MSPAIDLNGKPSASEKPAIRIRILTVLISFASSMKCSAKNVAPSVMRDDDQRASAE